MDEAGSRVHISNIVVPKEIETLEAQIETIREEKIKAVKSQNYELAASFRDKEKDIQAQLETAKQKWEEELQEHREIVDRRKNSRSSCNDVWSTGTANCQCRKHQVITHG